MKILSKKQDARLRTSARFTDAEVREIRKAAREGKVSRREQARLWGCGTETIARIVRGDTYYWVAEEDEREETGMAKVEVTPEMLAESQRRLMAMLEAEG